MDAEAPTTQEQIQFQLPQKQITNIETLNRFIESRHFSRFLQFLEDLSVSVKGKDNESAVEICSVVQSLCSVIQRLSTWVDEIKPKSQTGRFANPAYRDWFAKMDENTPSLLREVLPESFHPAVIELTVYFKNSFGDRTRMDYGTGHEMNFAAFLYCLNKINAITRTDFPAVVVKVFLSYLELMRKVQLTYWLEPAGSKGVWMLDDYQFLPFYFGAAQLIGHPHLKPKALRDVEIYETFSKKYMFMGCIKFINQVKKGPFFEHSPTLDSIGNVLTWEKVHGGLMKMYQAEVICKFPVMQHFFTGGIFPLHAQ